MVTGPFHSNIHRIHPFQLNKSISVINCLINFLFLKVCIYLINIMFQQWKKLLDFASNQNLILIRQHQHFVDSFPLLLLLLSPVKEKSIFFHFLDSSQNQISSWNGKWSLQRVKVLSFFLSIKDQHIKNIFVIFAFINIKFFKHKHLTVKLIQSYVLNISMINLLTRFLQM